MTEIKNHELPIFDVGGWTSCMRHGMLWYLFEDKTKQMDSTLYDEAVEVVKECIRTKNPPFGGWR